MAFLIAAMVIGFLGSFHCLGMCGPIALALPVRDAGPAKKLLLVLSYNFGRIITYSLFGLLAGTLGSGFVVAGYQQALSVTIGLLILLSVFFTARHKGNYLFNSKLFLFFNTIKTQLGRLFLKQGQGPLLLIGALNGLLPCGLVYLGIAGAAASGSVLNGALFMAVFGLGTVPVMLSLSFIGSSLSIGVRSRIRKTVPVITVVMAMLLILRGLNLGIPYLSPKAEQSTVTASCHQQLAPPATIIKCCPVPLKNK